MSLPGEAIRSLAVSLAGRVVVQDPAVGPRPLAGARVELMVPPSPGRAGVQTTAADGSYFFQGLAPGSYAVLASFPAAGRLYGVAHSPGETVLPGQTTWAADVVLPQTTLTGKVTVQGIAGPGNGMVTVQLLGCEARAVSDASGQYVLTGIQSSQQQQRTIQVAFRGMRATCPDKVTIAHPGDVATCNLTLTVQANQLTVAKT